MKKNCYKRKDGRWQYSRQEDGYLYYTIANTYRELIEKIKNIKPKQIRNIKNYKNKKLTFLEYYDLYYKSYVENKDITNEVKKSWLSIKKNWIEPNFKRLPLENITTEQIQDFINKIDKERTQEIIYQRIARILKKAYITGRIKKNISEGLEKPKRKNIEIREPLNLEEQVKLINYVKNTKFYPFIMFSLIVGSRREETIKFNIKEDLDTSKQVIHIKGTKTKNADRKVKISEEFMKFLQENMKEETFNFKSDYITREISKIFKILNINNCLHGLRHTCSANLYFLGAKDKYRQLQLGHSSIVITNNIYTNIKENISREKLREIYGDFYPHFD